MDSAGNFYGTSLYCTLTHGGANSNGAVIELAPKSGGWTETLFHSFGGTQGDGGALAGAGGDYFLQRRQCSLWGAGGI